MLVRTTRPGIRFSTRMAAGTLVLALPLAAAAGCGAAKKRTIKQELTAAQQHLADSSATSVTLRLTDAKGNITRETTKSGDLDAATIKEILGGSITYTFDGKSASKITGVDAKASEGDLKKALADVHLAIAVKDATTTLGELRLVDSTLFARLDVKEIDRVATEAGAEGFESSFDDFIDSAPAEYQPALKDVKAGQWLKLPLTSYLGKIQKSLKDLPTTGTSKSELDRTGKDLFTAVKPYIKVTDANDDADHRVLNVDIDARPAVKAGLAVLKKQKGLPFLDALTGVSDSDIDDGLAAGKAHGTITLADGHLTQVTVDIDSIRKLDPEQADSDVDLAGSDVVLDIDDSAEQVKAPTSDVSDTDVKALIDDLFGQFTEGFSSSLGGDSSYSG